MSFVVVVIVGKMYLLKGKVFISIRLFDRVKK